LEEGRDLFEDTVLLEGKKNTEHPSEEIYSSLEIRIFYPSHKKPEIYPFTDLFDVGRCSL
jgi:hypothetical protein